MDLKCWTITNTCAMRINITSAVHLETPNILCLLN